MSNDLLIEQALERQKVFKNLPANLAVIKHTVNKLDPNAEVYLFGSVAEDRYNYSSDIDVLILTRMAPANVLAELWRAGIKDPFEIHVYLKKEKETFASRSKLVKI